MKILIAALFLAAFALPEKSAIAQLHWQSREFTQTASAESTEAVARYTFRNTGQKPVEIVSVSSSCGCTAAKPDKTLYQPGEAGHIEANFVFGSRTGDQRKTITVRTREEGGKPKHETLTMRVTIPVLAKVTPGFIFWRLPPEAPSGSNARAGSPTPAPSEAALKAMLNNKAAADKAGLESKTIRVTFEDDQPIRVLEAASAAPQLKTEIREVQAGKAYDIIVTPQSLTPGLNTAITIKTDAKPTRWQTLEVRARVVAGHAKPAREAASPMGAQMDAHAGHAHHGQHPGRGGPAGREAAAGQTPGHLRSSLQAEPRMLLCRLGEKPEPMTVVIEPVEGVEVENVQTRVMGEGFSVELKEEQEGKKYLLVVTPAGTDSPANGMVMVMYSTAENQRMMPLRIPLRVWPAQRGRLSPGQSPEAGTPAAGMSKP